MYDHGKGEGLQFLHIGGNRYRVYVSSEVMQPYPPNLGSVVHIYPHSRNNYWMNLIFIAITVLNQMAFKCFISRFKYTLRMDGSASSFPRDFSNSTLSLRRPISSTMPIPVSRVWCSLCLSEFSTSCVWIFEVNESLTERFLLAFSIFSFLAPQFPWPLLQDDFVPHLLTAYCRNDVFHLISFVRSFQVLMKNAKIRKFLLPFQLILFLIQLRLLLLS